MIRLTAVDQSPVQHGSVDTRPAPQLSLDLARSCEEWGYHRFWLAEHHNTTYFAGPCPEVLAGYIAGGTEKIRVGSGGVMLSHYSPYKVAEQFRMLETLYPGRIDLGIGRAPGGDGLASAALAYPFQPVHGEAYPRQAQDLKNYLGEGLEPEHPYRYVRVMPDQGEVQPCPELWMLGSSGGSAALAGTLGYHLALALFISPQGQTRDIMDNYLRAWQEAGHDGEPQTMIAIGAYCAPTDEEAKFMTAPQVYKKTLGAIRGDNQPWISPEEVMNNLGGLNMSERQYYDRLMDSFTVGSPETCRKEIHQIAEYWGTEEIAVLAVTWDYESRKNSYRHLAESLI